MRPGLFSCAPPDHDVHSIPVQLLNGVPVAATESIGSPIKVSARRNEIA